MKEVYASVSETLPVTVLYLFLIREKYVKKDSFWAPYMSMGIVQYFHITSYLLSNEYIGDNLRRIAKLVRSSVVLERGGAHRAKGNDHAA